MYETVEEKVKSKLLKAGKKSRLTRVFVVPVLATYMFFIHVYQYCKGNMKRFALMFLMFFPFVIYSSFSFPIFITAEDAEASTSIVYDENANAVSLVAETTVDLEGIELLDDEDVIGDLEHEMNYREDVDASEVFGEYSEYGTENWEQYNAEDILNSSQGRTPSTNSGERTEGSVEEILANADFSKDDWSLVLINKQHSVPEEYTFTLGTITGGLKCDERIIGDLLDMLQDAKEENINLIIRSPYRDESRQEYLFNRKIKRYMDLGMSYLEAFQMSSQTVTVPGASEHQIGLALDITSDTYTPLEAGFGDTEAGEWLADNCCKYGFILRYPLGKEYITGIEYEPWHFRYVGVEAATVIMEQGITLEEFWEEYL